MEPQWVEVGTRRVPVLDSGRPDGPPAVLLPGLTDGLAPVTSPQTRRMLADAPLPMQRFRCLVVSYRHPAIPPLTTCLLADDVAALLEHLVDEPAWLFTHSMGAMVAQHLAADRPDLVAGMVLSATLPRADDAFRAVLDRWARLVRDRCWEGFTEDALSTAYTGSELLRRRAALRLLPPPEYDDDLVTRHLALTTACATHDATDRLPSIRCPTLVLAGEHDQVCPSHHAETLAAGIPDAELHIFDGLGHGFPEQAPRRFLNRVLSFIEAVTA